YLSLSSDRRRALHASAAVVVEKLSPQIVDRQPEVVAHHLTGAGLTVQAVRQWHRAGRAALRRSASAEAVAHLTQALRLTESVAPGRERDGLELGVQLLLGPALVGYRGYGANEIERTLERLRTLTDEVSDAPEVPLARFALWRFATARTDFDAAERLA